MINTKEAFKPFLWLCIFAAAMGFLEAAVVIYMRRIFYPAGFGFPLHMFDPSLLFIEWLREVATIIMLVSAAVIAGKNFLQKFSFFLYSFAVWDISYYAFLKLALNWPASFFTWDLLFLIPISWVGPVLAPIINSLTMILMAVCFVYVQKYNKSAKLELRELALIIFGGIIILYTYLIDYSLLIAKNGFLPDFFSLATNQNFIALVSGYIPETYNWELFIIGEALILYATWRFYRRNDF